MEGLGPLLCEVADAWTPAERIGLVEWCEKHIRLPRESSANPGPPDFTRYPYLRELLDAADDPEVERLVLMFSPQTGKTTFLQMLLAASAVLAPAPAMLGAADKDSLLELRDKFYALCEASETLLPLVPPPRLRNNRWIDIGHSRCHLAYSYNTQRMSGKSCRLVLCTEIDRWRKTKTHGDPRLIIHERVKAFFRWLIVEESTPSDANSAIDAAYRLSNQCRYLVPCPHCNHYQELRFFPRKKGPYAGCGGIAGLRDERGEWVEADRAVAEAHYLCECGCRIESAEKSEMVGAGRWIPKGQSLDARGQLVGQPLRSRRITGARLNALYADTIDFGRFGAKFLECRGKQAALQVFWNDWLCQKWTKRGKTPKWRELWRRLRGEHEPGLAPQAALFLTAGADPGPGYVRWTIRAWGEGSTSWLVAWGTTRADRDRANSRTAHLEALVAEVLSREFPLAAPNVLGDASLRVALLAIDVGYKPHRVHEWRRSLPPELQQRVRQVVGRNEIADGSPWRKRLVEVNSRTGKPYAGGQQRWEISRAIYSSELHDRWRQPLDEPGAWFLTSASLGQCELYVQELTNEAPIRKADKTGRMRTFWGKIKKSVGNHYGDCEVYSMAGADMLVGRKWENLAGRLRKRREP
ncbi:MAG TPA: terminase gpA endonuclease subunit, partial [Pirellulales bacterium]|nr:terminase gpA endonuclease subunit [Pirellulales bacterium]